MAQPAARRSQAAQRSPLQHRTSVPGSRGKAAAAGPLTVPGAAVGEAGWVGVDVKAKGVPCHSSVCHKAGAVHTGGGLAVGEAAASLQAAALGGRAVRVVIVCLLLLLLLLLRVLRIWRLLGSLCAPRRLCRHTALHLRLVLLRLLRLLRLLGLLGLGLAVRLQLDRVSGQVGYVTLWVEAAQPGVHLLRASK